MFFIIIVNYFNSVFFFFFPLFFFSFFFSFSFLAFCFWGCARAEGSCCCQLTAEVKLYARVPKNKVYRLLWHPCSSTTCVWKQLLAKQSLPGSCHWRCTREGRCNITTWNEFWCLRADEPKMLHAQGLYWNLPSILHMPFLEKCCDRKDGIDGQVGKGSYQVFFYLLRIFLVCFVFYWWLTTIFTRKKNLSAIFGLQILFFFFFKLISGWIFSEKKIF